MVAIPKAKRFNFDEYCKIIRPNQKADLIGGVIYMASPDNTDANRLNMWLGRLLADYADSKDAGEVFGSCVACRLSDEEGPEPDLAFVKKKNLHRVKHGFIDGPCDIAVEIVSPESVDRDYNKKRAQYQRGGIPEYWIIDDVQEKTVFLRLDAKGKYRELHLKKRVFHSEVLPGFWLNVDWFWEKPLPKKAKVLKQILGEE